MSKVYQVYQVSKVYKVYKVWEVYKVLLPPPQNLLSNFSRAYRYVPGLGCFQNQCQVVTSHLAETLKSSDLLRFDTSQWE